MPYIVTTWQPCPEGHAEPLLQGDGYGWDGAAYHTPPCDVCGDRCEVIAGRRAVATLEGREVWNALYGVDVPDRQGTVDAIAALPESGGTIGPHVDGTVIEVEPVTIPWLAERAEGFLPAEIIADFNAKQAA